jgi:hypothetical protein
MATCPRPPSASSAGSPPRQTLALARTLVTAQLWVPVGATGYRFHNYLAYQSSKHDVEKIRDIKRRAGQRGAAARWQTDGTVPSGGDGSCHASAMDTSIANSESESSPSSSKVYAKSPIRGDGGATSSKVALAPLQGGRRRGPDSRIAPCPSPKFRPAVNEGSLRLRTTCERRDERPRPQEQPPRRPAGEERVVSYLTRRVHRTGGRHDGRVARTREKHASCGVCADSEVHGLLAV